MKTENTALELIGMLFIGLLIGIPSAFYSAWVYLKIIQWYQIPIVLNIAQAFGILQIIALMLYKEDKSDSGFSKTIGKIFTRLVIISFVLGVMYLIHFFV